MKNVTQIGSLGWLNGCANMFMMRVSQNMGMMWGIIVTEDYLTRFILIMVGITQLHNLVVTEDDNFIKFQQ